MDYVMKEDWIYFAGLFDGEGNITIQEVAPSKRRKSPQHSMKITITNTDRTIINWMWSTFGGAVHYRKPRGGSHRSWAWVLCADQALQVLNEMLPYLRIKKPEAEIAIEFQEHISNWRDTMPKRTGKREYRVPLEHLAYRSKLAHSLRVIRHQKLNS